MRAKGFYLLIALLLVGSVVLVVKIIALQKIPDEKTFKVYLSNVRNGVEEVKDNCDKRYQRLERARKSANPSVVRALWSVDQLTLFADTAEFYFQRMETFKHDPDSATRCFKSYVQFSERFRKALLLNSTLQSKNYVLALVEKLPGEKLPFESPSEIQLVNLLLQDEFYSELDRAFDKLIDFTG